MNAAKAPAAAKGEAARERRAQQRRKNMANARRIYLRRKKQAGL